MPNVRVLLTDAEFKRLVEEAAAELRPPDWHAAYIVRQALRLPHETDDRLTNGLPGPLSRSAKAARRLRPVRSVAQPVGEGPVAS